MKEKIPDGTRIAVRTPPAIRDMEIGIVTGQSEGCDGLVYYYMDTLGNPKWCYASQVILLMENQADLEELC